MRAMPGGLDTVLAAGGHGFSAGEAQLLAFTRLLLRDPGLVILDEAASRLDPVTERRLEAAIDRLLADRTAVIVAHRLHTVQRADDILILEQGRVVEYGPRREAGRRPRLALRRACCSAGWRRCWYEGRVAGRASCEGRRMSDGHGMDRVNW